jgi:ATP-dependent RNA helicase DeaD
MEQAGHDGISRSHNIAYTLPMTGESLAQVVTPALERIDAGEGTIQLMILTADAETALAISDLIYQITGPQGVHAIPVTSANRAARLIEGKPVHAVVGAPLELQTLVQRSTLKLDSIRTVVLAWADEILVASPDAAASLEALFAELPKDAAHILVSRKNTPEIEQLIERYLWRARRIDGTSVSAPTEGTGEPIAVQYLTVSSPARTIGLQRLLDELDPPSAAVVVRSENSRDVAVRAIHQLGYREDGDPISVIHDAPINQGTHTIIFFDAPISRAELETAAAVAPVQIISLITPREIDTLRDITDAATPLALRGPGANARQRDRVLRDELQGVLAHGIASRELLALEPLLDQHDGIEIAAAAVRLLERERQRTQSIINTPPAPRQTSESRGSSRPGFNDRGKERGRDVRGRDERGRDARRHDERRHDERGRDDRGRDNRRRDEKGREGWKDRNDRFSRDDRPRQNRFGNSFRSDRGGRGGPKPFRRGPRQD